MKVKEWTVRQHGYIYTYTVYEYEMYGGYIHQTLNITWTKETE